MHQLLLLEFALQQCQIFTHAIVAAIGSLKGPLHGGANEAAMEMIENWKTRDEARENILNMLANKGKIMGFGHAIYSERDPRNAVIKEFSKELSQEYGDDSLYQVSEEVEKVMWDEKKLFPNADIFSCFSIFLLGHPNKIIYTYFCYVSSYWLDSSLHGAKSKQ